MALRTECTAAGLVDERGAHTVSAHRCRHTVGAELAESGARLQTVMAVLGHRSAAVSLIYARLTDPTVPAEASESWPASPVPPPMPYCATGSNRRVHWLQSNFIKTDLELGHRVRLSAEGPCECDLVLTCPKFLIPGDYTPRLQARFAREDEFRLCRTLRRALRSRATSTHTRISEGFARGLGWRRESGTKLPRSICCYDRRSLTHLAE